MFALCSWRRRLPPTPCGHWSAGSDRRFCGPIAARRRRHVLIHVTICAGTSSSTVAPSAPMYSVKRWRRRCRTEERSPTLSSRCCGNRSCALANSAVDWLFMFFLHVCVHFRSPPPPLFNVERNVTQNSGDNFVWIKCMVRRIMFIASSARISLTLPPPSFNVYCISIISFTS